ncbi:hypothetical protein [Pseudomonas phage UF_RH7]|nr:hypothetical protein [Pseudomonas phage UF_RH7]
MPKRIAVHTLVLTRDGKRVNVKPGTLVDLTAEEVKELNALNAIRLPVNETGAPEDEAPKAEDKKSEDKAPKTDDKKAGAKKEEDL